MKSCSTQAVRPLVGLAADQVIRDRHKGCLGSQSPFPRWEHSL
ncbi:MAG: hypothetical protein ACQESR_02940 [Planctomycetota bacterium]